MDRHVRYNRAAATQGTRGEPIDDLSVPRDCAESQRRCGGHICPQIIRSLLEVISKPPPEAARGQNILVLGVLERPGGALNGR